MVDTELQRRLGFADHALVRFGQRAGLLARDRATLERLLRDLLDQEGRVVAERPRWARSRNTADAYVQVGEWLLLICRHDARRPGSLTVVTVVNGAQGTTWARAVARGLLRTPPPLAAGPPRRPPFAALAAALRNEAERSGWLLPRLIAERRVGRATHREGSAAHAAARSEHEELRRRARLEHRRRHG